MKFLSPRIILPLALVIGRLEANTIFWFSTVNGANQMSSGAPMGGTFEFQLGVFTEGFVPVLSNMASWSSHWTAAQTASYNPANGAKFFTNNFLVSANPPPFTVGAKGYIWGRSTTATGSEWILFRKSTWTWPAPDPDAIFTIDWSTATANEVILGSINSNGSPYLMKSEAVQSYPQWQTAQLAGELLIAPNDDPDHDGSPNLLEFIFGSSPTQAGAPAATPVSLVDVSGQKYLQISVPRLRNRIAQVVVEVSGDLVNWSSGPAHTLEISNTSSALVVRDLVPGGPGLAPRFMRAKAVIPP